MFQSWQGGLKYGCLEYDVKMHLRVRLWRVWSTPSLLFLPGPVLPRIVVPARVPSMDQIDLYSQCILSPYWLDDLLEDIDGQRKKSTGKVSLFVVLVSIPVLLRLFKKSSKIKTNDFECLKTGLQNFFHHCLETLLTSKYFLFCFLIFGC